MLRLPLLAAFAALACALGACASPPVDASGGATTAAIVGGNIDQSWPAAGYLVAKITTGPHAGELVRPICGATLIAPSAVMTSATCVEEQFQPDRTIVGVGFGGDPNGPTLEVVGGWHDWVHPKFATTFTDPSGTQFPNEDPRYAVAIIPLKTAPAGLVPMTLALGPIPPNTPATVIGYGRVLPGDFEEGKDDLASLAANPDRYPGVRKSAGVLIDVARNMIDAYPAPSTPDRAAGATCFGDLGGPLILPGGTLAGVLASFTADDVTAASLDHTPLCRMDTGGSYANVQFSDVPAFVQQRLAEIGAGTTTATSATTEPRRP